MYRPWTLRKFGVEMEATTRNTGGGSVSGSSIKRALETALRPVDEAHAVNPREPGYYHSDGTTWDVKTDSSCGWEIAAPALTLDNNGDNPELKAATAALESLNIVVDRSCGTHIHFEVRDYEWQDLQRLMILWSRYEPFFYELMPRARRMNSYCAPLHRTQWTGQAAGFWTYAQQALRAGDRASFQRAAQYIERRCALNITHWWRSQRIEVRLHSGTINYTKITRWAMLMMAVINRPRRRDLPPIEMFDPAGVRAGFSTEYICKALGLLPTRQVPDVPPESIQLVAWLNARRLQFTPESANIPAVPPVVVPPSPRQAAAQAAVDAALSRRSLLRGLLGQSHIATGVDVCCAQRGVQWRDQRFQYNYHGCPNEPVPGHVLCRTHMNNTTARMVNSDVEGWITAEESEPVPLSPEEVARRVALARHVGQRVPNYRVGDHPVCIAQQGGRLGYAADERYHGCPAHPERGRVLCMEHMRDHEMGTPFRTLTGWIAASPESGHADWPVGTLVRIRMTAPENRARFRGMTARVGVRESTQHDGEVSLWMEATGVQVFMEPQWMERMSETPVRQEAPTTRDYGWLLGGTRVRVQVPQRDIDNDTYEARYYDMREGVVREIDYTEDGTPSEVSVMFEGYVSPRWLNAEIVVPADEPLPPGRELRPARPGRRAPQAQPEPQTPVSGNDLVIPTGIPESRTATTGAEPLLPYGTRVRAVRAFDHGGTGVRIARGWMGTVVNSILPQSDGQVMVVWDRRVAQGRPVYGWRTSTHHLAVMGVGVRGAVRPELTPESEPTPEDVADSALEEEGWDDYDTGEWETPDDDEDGDDAEG